MSDNPEDDFLEVPATESKVRLGDAAYTGAALSTMFAPGAGVADVMGYAPDPFNPGQMSPSFSENVEQGNYLDAGLQTLGVAGDAMYAMAPFTAGITALPGGVLKGAQALAKTLRGGTIPNPKTTTPQVFFPDLGEKSHVTLQPDVKNDAVSIMYIEADKPGQGQGSEMLRRVTEQADATGTRLTLYPDPRGEGGLDQDELIEFYQRNGFEFQYPDPTNPDPILDMVREPRPPVQSSTLYRSEAQSYESPNEGAVFYTPDKSYAELYASEDRVFRETSLPANVFDIREPGNSEAVLNWVDQKISNLEDISGVSVDIRDVYAGIEQGGPQGASRALAAYNTILAKQADRSIIPGQAEKMFMQDFGIDAMTIKEAGRDLDEYSVAFKDAPRPTAPKSGLTPQDFEFYQDNPAVSRPDSGKEWLESNIRYTEERYADREPSMLRGPITANLGSRNTDMFLSTDELTRLPGAMGETRGPGDPNFDRLLKQIKTEGFDPDQAGNKVVVGVNHKGEAYLMEGNTRAAVAKELGIPNIKTEVRYWNGGEMIDGPYKPEAVAARAVVNKAEGGVITLADVARNMNRRPRGVAALAPIARNMNRPMVS